MKPPNTNTQEFARIQGKMFISIFPKIDKLFNVASE